MTALILQYLIVGHGLDWIGLGAITVTTFFLKINNHCSAVDAVSFKL